MLKMYECSLIDFSSNKTNPTLLYQKSLMVELELKTSFVASDHSDGDHIITLNAVEKKNLIEFLTENQV